MKSHLCEFCLDLQKPVPLARPPATGSHADATSLALTLGPGGGLEQRLSQSWLKLSPQILSRTIANGERGLGVDWAPTPSTTGGCGDLQPRRMWGQGTEITTRRRLGWPELRLQPPDRFLLKADGAGRPHVGRGGRGFSRRRLGRVPAPLGPGCRGHGLEGLGRLTRAQPRVSVST